MKRKRFGEEQLFYPGYDSKQQRLARSHSAEWPMRSLRIRYPEFISAIHRRAIGDQNLRTTAIFKCQVAEAMKTNDPARVAESSRTQSQVEQASSRGAQSTRDLSDQFARLMAPVLADIVSKNPKLALAVIANTLNELGRPAV